MRVSQDPSPSTEKARRDPRPAQPPGLHCIACGEPSDAPVCALCIEEQLQQEVHQ